MAQKRDEPYLALLAYRSTPVTNGYSPAELLMNRRLRTNVPVSREARVPRVPDKTLLLEREEELRRKQKCNFNHRHWARDLSPALPGNVVWLPDRKQRGTIGDQVIPRSYQVETPSCTFRCNRRDIVRLPTEEGSPRIQDFDQETMSED